MWDFSSLEQGSNKPLPPILESHLNHWTTREAPKHSFLLCGTGVKVRMS